MLAETLLRGDASPLTRGERELIAAYTSSLNDCTFCCSSHSAAARHQLSDPDIVNAVLRDAESAPVSEKMKSLLAIAKKVQQGGRGVGDDEVARARKAGAGDREIHDAVLISAAFCMYNRYVDGLRTFAPADEGLYDEMGKMLATQGYKV